MESLAEQIIETWNIHNRIHRYMLDAIPDECLKDNLGGKGRTVGDIFAHVHNVRLMWLQAAAPDLMEGQTKLDKGGPDRAALYASLDASAAAVAILLQRGLEAGGKIKNFKPHATALLGYLISHESHHRGQVTLILKQNGHALDNKTDFGMWEWGTR